MVEHCFIRFSKKPEYIFIWKQAFTVLQVNLFKSEGKMFSHIILFNLLTSIILFCRQHRCCVHALLIVNLKGTDVMYL